MKQLPLQLWKKIVKSSDDEPPSSIGLNTISKSTSYIKKTYVSEFFTPYEAGGVIARAAHTKVWSFGTYGRRKVVSSRDDISSIHVPPMILECKGFYVETGTNQLSKHRALYQEGQTDRYYRKYFYNREHANFIGSDKEFGTLVFSIVRESSPGLDIFRIVEKSKNGDKSVSLPATLVTGTSASKINVTTTDGTPGSPISAARRNSDKALSSNLKLKDLKYLIKIVNPNFPQKKTKTNYEPKI